MTPSPSALHPGPDTAAPAAASDAGVDPLRQDPIRRVVVHRLAVAGRRHARHRVDRAGRPDRPGPHAVLVLFARPVPAGREPTSPDPRTTVEVTLATRMFLDGPDVTDLPTLLATITDRARDYGRLPLQQLVANLCDRVEPYPPASGISASACPASTAPANTPTRCRETGSRISSTAPAWPCTPPAPRSPPDIASTHTLSFGPPMLEHHPWRWAATPTTRARDPAGPGRRAHPAGGPTPAPVPVRRRRRRDPHTAVMGFAWLGPTDRRPERQPGVCRAATRQRRPPTAPATCRSSTSPPTLTTPGARDRSPPGRTVGIAAPVRPFRHLVAMISNE